MTSTRFLIAATIVTWFVVCASGLWLMRETQPTAAAAFQDIATLRDSVQWNPWMQGVHFISAIAAVLLGILGGLRATRLVPSRSLGAAFFVLAVLSLVAIVLAYLIPWGQLALLDRATGDGGVFIALGGGRWSFATYRNLRTVHQLVIPVIGSATIVVVAATGLRHWAAGSAGDRDADVVE